MTRPFSGIRVLDFTQVFAGPFGSYQLALLGADVIKIERPGGEDMRFSPPSKLWADRAMAPMWASANANKRNLALDLKDPDAVGALRHMAKSADVVMENFRPGVMDRLGLGYEALSEINPGLIYCAVSGFGQNGPDRETAAYDGRIQATSGIMSVTGHAETGPVRAGFAVCDAIGGMTAAFAVASALFQRSHTGKGQMVDVAMLDAALSFMSPAIVEYLVAGHLQGQYGNQAVSRKPTANLFRAGDGHLLLAVNNEKQFRALCAALGREDLLEDPRFADWDARAAHADELRDIVEAAFADGGAEVWEDRLEEAGAPSARIRSIADAVGHRQIAHRDVLQEVEGPWGPMRLVGSGFRLAHGSGAIDRPPPLPGQHSEEVLREAGVDDALIERLLANAGETAAGGETL